MAVKVYDTISPASNSFPALMAEHVNLVREDGTTDSIQNLFNNKELGAGGDTSSVLTEAEFLALPEEERLNNSYYLYDIGVHYKNGIAYSRKEPISLTMAEYKALEEVDPDQEYIITSDEQGILLEASDIGYSNAVSNLPCTTVQGAIDKVAEKVDGLIDDEVSDSTVWSSKKTSDEIAKVDASLGEIEKKIGNIDNLKLINLGENVDADNCKIAYGNINCVYGYCGYFTQNVPMKGYAVIRCYHYGSGIRQFIDYTASTARTYTRFIQYNGQTPTAWKELATMDKLGGLKFSASGTTLTITNGTNTWTLKANS